MVSLKEIESWCYKQIELINRLYDMKEPDGISRCGLLTEQDVARAKSIHIYEGIDYIGAALKLPVKIRLFDDEMSMKTVTHLGVQFYQLEWYPK